MKIKAIIGSAAAGGMLCVLWTLPGQLRHLTTLPDTPQPVTPDHAATG